MNKEQSPEQEKDFIIEKAKELISYLDGSIPESDGYIKPQVILNTIMFSFFFFFKESVIEEKRELFFEEFVNTLRENIKKV